MYKIYHCDKKGMHRASAALLGTMVGAGIFALPYAIAKSGVPIGLFWMISLAIVALITHIMFGEVVINTPGKHRLVGYVGIHLGRWQRGVQAFAAILGLMGGSLAYLILGGIFLSQLASPIIVLHPTFWSVAMFLMVGVTVWKGANFMAKIDFWLSIGLVGVFLLLIAKNFANIEPANLLTVNVGNAFLPYGIILFAFSGISAITEMKEICSKPSSLRKSIVYGTLGAVVLTILFTVTTVGVLGPATSPEAINGLAARFGGVIPMVGAAAGFLAVITSYIVFSLFLKEQFHYDFKWPQIWSWSGAVVVPFILFLMGIRSFGKVLEIVGSVLGGISGIFVCLAYLAVKKKHPKKVLNVPRWVVSVLIFAYGAGALYGLIFRLL